MHVVLTERRTLALLSVLKQLSYLVEPGTAFSSLPFSFSFQLVVVISIRFNKVALWRYIQAIIHNIIHELLFCYISFMTCS